MFRINKRFIGIILLSFFIGVLTTATIYNFELNKLNNAYNELKAKYDFLQNNYNELKVSYTSLKNDYNWLINKFNELTNDYNALKDKYNTLEENYNLLKEEYYLLKATMGINFSRSPPLNSTKTITYTEFKNKVFEVFTYGFFGSVRERLVPSKVEVELFVYWAKPHIITFTHKALILYAMFLQQNDWKKTAIGIYYYQGKYFVTFYTDEGWISIDDNLMIMKITAESFTYPPAPTFP